MNAEEHFKSSAFVTSFLNCFSLQCYIMYSFLYHNRANSIHSLLYIASSDNKIHPDLLHLDTLILY